MVAKITYLPTYLPKNEIHLKELDSIAARYLNKSNRSYYILFSNIKHLYSYFLYGDEETKFVVDGKWRRYYVETDIAGLIHLLNCFRSHGGENKFQKYNYFRSCFIMLYRTPLDNALNARVLRVF